MRRFFAKVSKQADGCWVWTASLGSGGYGGFHTGVKKVRAHRWAYEHLVGPIPAGLQLDHLCRVRNCVNPDHLEPVDNSENQLRGYRARWAEGPRLCREGHELSGENLYASPRNPDATRCRTCNNSKNAARNRARRRAMKG